MDAVERDMPWNFGERIAHWELVLQDGSFEETLNALEEVVAHLEDGELTLDESLRCYELGVMMSRRCEKMIDEAELRVSRLALDDRFSSIDDLVDESTKSDSE